MEDNQLTQPILNPISAFDATQQYTFTFVVIGGNQVVANMLTINDNSDGSQVYQATQSTMRLEHVLPANILENGHYYSVTVQTIDNAEQLSEASVAVPFYCYSTPSLTISNMPSSGTINNNSYTFQGAYSQSEGEALNSYQFTLYNNNREVISQTPLIYYSSDSSLQYTFTGMSSNTSYFIELSGQTVNGTQITSGVLSFNVNYSSSASFAICDLVNDCENGYIQISSNVVAIQGNSNPEPPIYIDDKEVDLREDGSYVNWDSGFNIQNDFTMRVWGRDFNPYEDIINMSNNQDSDEDPNRINMKWMLGDIDKELPEYTNGQGSFINIQNSQSGNIENLELYGITIQEAGTPSVNSPKQLYSLGDIKNLINVENFNITYSQQYSQDTNTQFILKPNYTYTLSFDYLINNATTDLYYSIGYGTTSYTTDIATQIQYNTQIEGRNYYTFTVPANIPENNYLWIKFGQTIILADIDIDISNIQLEKGIYNTDYQAPDIYNIYPTITKKNVFNNDNVLYLKNNNTSYTAIQNGYNIVPTQTTGEAYLAIGYSNFLEEGNSYAISLNYLGQFSEIKLYTIQKNTQQEVGEISLTNNSFSAPSNIYDIEIRLYIDNTINTNYAQVWNIQLEANTTVTTYETYEEQKVDISLNSPIYGMTSYRDLICLKSPNLLNPNNQSANLTANREYYFSQNETTPYYLWFYNEDNVLITFVNESGESTNHLMGTRFSFISPANTVKMIITKSENSEANDVTSEEIIASGISIIEGNVEKPYYPYIVEPSIIRYFDFKTLTADDTWSIGSAPNQNNTLYFAMNYNQQGLFSHETNCMCNKLPFYPANYLWNNDEEGIAQSQSQIIVRVSKSTVSNLNAFKNYLTTSNISGIFRKSVPTVEALSSSISTSLSNLVSNNPITNIFYNNIGSGNIFLKYISSYSVQETQNAYVILRCYNNNDLPYIITSNYIDIPSDTDKVFIWVRRVNNIFDLRIENLGDYSEGGGGDDTTDPVVTIEADPIITSNSITITANAIDDTGLRTIRFSKNNGSTWDEERAIDGLSVTEEYTFADLTADTQYAIRVEAIDLSGNIGGISEQLTTAAS